MLRLALPSVLFVPLAVSAQVSVNSGALDQLKPSAPPSSATAPKPPVRRPARRPVPRAHPAAAAPVHAPPAVVAKPAAPPPSPRPVSLAPAPPPAVALAPLVEAPPHPLPPPPVPIVADAAGDATKIMGGIRITFGAGKADLNPTTAAAVSAVAQVVKADPNIDLNVYAYAAGPPDDPSTPRRLSLSRALAARAVLISEGIASTRIYVRALGATASDGPPDRVDVTQAGIAAAPTAPPPPAKP